MANEIEIRISKQDKSNLDEVARNAKRAGQQIADGLNDGFKDAEKASERAQKQISEDLDKTAHKAKETGGEAGDGLASGLTESLASGDVQGAFEGVLEGVKGGGGAWGAAGVGLGLALVGGMMDSLAQENVGGLLAAQLGAMPSEAGRFGHLAGQVYADNFGDSIEDVADSIKAVVQNKLVDATAPDEAIRNMTEIAMTASKVVGEDANAISRAARQMLVTGLAGSAQEAFDMIVQASQNGLNVNEDLIDTIVEYGTEFRELGLKGPEALGLISQAMAAGARDTDYAADALKEFAIRAKDGSESSIRGFQSLGLESEQMMTMISQGGDRAHQALGVVLQRLRDMDDPLQRDQAAVDLFGTKAEDLGNALYEMDLDTAADEMGNFAGATDRAAASVDTTGAKFEGFMRGAKQRLAELGDVLVTSVEDTQSMFLEATGQVSHRFVEGYKLSLRESVHANEERAGSAIEGWLKEGESIKAATRSLQENIDLQQKAQGVALNLSEAQIKYQQAIDDAAASVKEHGKTLNLDTEDGRANQEMLNGLARATLEQTSAMERQGAQADQLNGFMAGARQQFIDVAHAMGMGIPQASALADQLQLVGRPYEARVSMNASNFYAVGSGVFATLRELGKGVTVPLSGRVGAGLHFAHGGIVGAGPVLARAEGGPGHTAIIQNEAGPEVALHPDGTMIIPAGMSRQIMAAAMGGGSGGVSGVRVIFAGDLDSMMATAWMKAYGDGLIRIEGVS